jgi:hypothetical protein
MVIDMRNIYDYYDDANNVPLEKVELNVKQCNEIAHEAIAARERIFVSDIILNAAKKGCFSTILPTISQDTRNWINSLGFNTFTNTCGLNVCWDDKVIKDA